jgi:4-hydroxy-tetrahydrodipicolinate synthase
MENRREETPPPAEVYPVMLTPFTDGNEVDFESLKRLIHWYEDGGATGLFAVCLSSEMFQLSIEERVAIGRFTKQHAKVPVVASGHLGGDFERQLNDVQAMAETGVDAVVFVSNAFAGEDENDLVLIKNLGRLLNGLETTLPLGIYECPVPYKRVLSDEVIAFMVSTDRFVFLKDTCCDIAQIKRRLNLIEGSSLKLYNAHAQTLFESLTHRATGNSGIQANCSIKLLSRICSYFSEPNRIAEDLNLLYRVAEFCVAFQYPVCAKEMLRARGVFQSIHTRAREMSEFSEESRLASSSILRDLLAFEDRLT